jgi:adenylate cyclase
VLQRVRAGPGVRLACQFRPTAAVMVTPLFDAARPAGELLRFRHGEMLGMEREIAILFADLRDFTRLSEQRLPFDVVHLLNRYFRSMGEAVEAAGGRVDKFIGDGVMALFGAERAEAPPEACRAALEAARLMSLRLGELNRSLGAEFGGALRIGIGVHAGAAIIGEMGFGRATSLTAIGDAVNTASRLEAACKSFGCELVASARVFRLAGLADIGEAHELMVRGRQEPLAVRTLASAAELPER